MPTFVHAMNKQMMIPVKEASHKKVFSLIRSQGQASGAMLAKQTGMQPSSLVYILNNLKEKGLIKICGHGNSTAKGGKRPVLWQINPDFGCIVGIEVMRSAIRAVLVNLAGDVILKAEKDFIPEEPDKIVLRICNTIKEIIDEYGFANRNLLYISLAVPGIVDPLSHKIIYSFGLKLQNFDLKNKIAEAFGVAAGVINDANAGAIGDQWFTGFNMAANNSLYISYNPMAGGIGLGIVINRKLYTGSNGLAGEYSFRIPSLKQIVKENFETINAKQVLLSVDDNLEKIQISELFYHAKNGCELSNQTLSSLCKHVAAEISRLIGLFDPDRITLGGDLSICEHMCCSEILIHLKTMLQVDYPFMMQIPQIDYARSKVFAVAIGATALYLTDMYTTT